MAIHRTVLVAAATRNAGHPIGPYLELLSDDDPAKGAITPPYWDETIGLMPVYRAMKPLPRP